MITSLLKKTIKPAIHSLVLLSYLVSFVLPVNVAYAHTEGVSGASIPAPPAPIVKESTDRVIPDRGNLVIDPKNPKAPHLDKSMNGTPLVNINQANSKGVSHNQFREFDVGTSGVIFNNSTQQRSTSQIGGGVVGNPYLNGQSARLILTEVTGRNTSQIRGVIEVHGEKAELIIVNPNGIDVNGAGFINIPKATLSTGQLQDLSNGRPIQLKVDGGEITIQGKGLSLKGVSQFDIVTRKINLDGAIGHTDDESSDVMLSAGTQLYDYESRTTTGTGDAPEAHAEPVYAIDSSALGGMYAGKITLISTEKGVGVRAPENMASRMSDITILANGDVVLKNTSSAKKLDVKSENGSVKVKKNKNVHGTEGIQIHASKALEVSENATVQAGTVVDLKAQDLKNHGKIQAGQKISSQITNQLANHGSMVSQGALDVSAKSMMNHGKIKSAGNLILRGFDSLDNQRYGKIESNGILLMNGKNLENHGAMLSQSLMDIRLSDNMLNDGWISSHRGLQILLNGDFLNTYQGDHIGGEILITGPLLIRGKDGQKARHIENRSASIETLGPEGHMSFKANLVQNKMAAYDYTPFDTTSPVEYDHSKRHRYQSKETRDSLNSKDDHAVLFASGNIDIEADKTVNEMSFITAVKSITLNGVKLIAKGRVLREETVFEMRRRKTKKHSRSDWYLNPKKPPIAGKIIDSQSLASWIHAGEDIKYNLKKKFNQSSELDQNVKGNVAYVASNRNESPEMVINSEDFAFQANESPFFKVKAGADQPFLIESRKKYVNTGSVMGSDYFLSRMGLGNAKRYGDAFVETRFLRKQIFENGLADRLSEAHTEAELMRQLYDNAIEEAKDLELYPGIKMTAELISKLKRDIIWMEKEVINGEEVLVPRLYVAKSTRASQLINNGMSAKNIDIKAGTVIAQGAILSQGKTHIEAQKSAVFVGANVDGKDTKMTAGETVYNYSSAIAGDSLAVKGQSIYSETVTRTIEGPHSSITTAQGQASFTSRAAPLVLESEKEGSQQYYGTNLHGAQGVQFNSEGAPVILGSVETGSHLAMNSRKHKRNEQHTHHVKSSVTTGAGYDVTYETGDLTFHGVDHHAGGNIIAKVDGTFENTPVHDYDYVQKSSKSKKSFGRKKSKDSTDMSDQVNRNVITAAGGTFSVISKADNHNVAPEIHAHEHVELLSTEGKVILESDKSTEQHVKNKSGSNIAWQKAKGHGSTDETVEEPVMDTPKLTADGALGTELSLKARGNLEQTLAALAADPNMAWAAELAKDPAIRVQLEKEYHKHWKYKQSGMTPEFTMVVIAGLALAGGALFAPAAAAGAGAAGAGAAAGGTVATGGAVATTASTVTLGSMGTAAASAVGKAVVSSAIVSGINNKGDPRLVVKDLTSKNQMKSLAMTAVTAGLTHGITGGLDIPDSTSSMTARMQNVAIQRGVNVAVSTTIGGENFRDSLKSNAIGGAIDFGAGLAAQKIGEAYHASEEAEAFKAEHPDLAYMVEDVRYMSPVEHLVAHGLVGAGTGFALGQNPLIHAATAVGGELTASAYKELAGDVDSKEQGIALARFASSAIALTLNGDVKDISGAIETGGRAAENNSYADQKVMEERDRIKREVAKKIIEEGLMSQEEMELNYYNLSLGELAEIVLKNKGIQRGTEPTYFDGYQDIGESWLVEKYSEMQKAREYYEAGNRDDKTVIKTMGIDAIDGSVDLAKAAYKICKDYKQEHLAETAIYRARNDNLWIDPRSGFGFADLKRFWYQDSIDRDNDLYLVRATKMERPEDFRNLAHGSVRGVIEKDIAEISGAFSQYGARRVGEKIGSAVSNDKKIQIDTGRTFEAVPELVSILMTGGTAGAAKVANGVGKGASAIARFTKGGTGFADAVAAAKNGSGLMDRGASVVSKTQVSSKSAAITVTEKSLARDIDLRVKPKSESILSASDSAQAFEAKFGKKAIQNMSDHELAQTLANRADKTALGEFGAAVGKQKHKYAEKVFNRYQKMTGQRLDLVAETRYKNGRLWEEGMGLQGSVKPDLYNKSTGEVFDYKFGDAVLGNNQIKRYEAALPEINGKVSTPIKVKPTIKTE